MPDVRPPAEPVRGYRLEVIAFALLLTGLALATAVFTYRPTQPESTSLLGWPGAVIAESLFEALGASAYALLAAWFSTAVVLLLRRSVWRTTKQLIGWVILIPCVALTADSVASTSLVPYAASNGGLLGAGLTQWIIAHFAASSRVIVYASLVSLGILLVADTAILWLMRQTTRAVRWMVQSIRLLLERTRNAKATPTAFANEKPAVSSPAPVRSLILEPNIVPISRSHAEPATTAASLPKDYELPPIKLLEDAAPFPHEQHDQYLRDVAALLEKTFADFTLKVRVVGIHTGPVVTQYEIALETGLRVNKVTALSDDLALNLKVPSVRIVAPIPGKNTVGIEVPNEHRAMVRLKELLVASAAKLPNMKLPLLLGKDTEGRPLVYDLAEMPHLLIAGRTGTGKSVCMNAIILSLLLTKRPDECRMIMIDPKRVEFSDYGKLPHLMCPVVKEDTKAEAILSWAVDKMEERYELLARARVRNIASYNTLTRDEILRRVDPSGDEQSSIPEKMPFIVIIIDEIGDLMMTMKKEVEGHIIRLAQKSRAAGIHLILATQKPTVDVITGLIKSNLPARICFQVSSRSDSRVVLDEMGADKLLGKGDMLFLQPGTSTLVRSQGAFASDNEIQRVVEHLECDPEFENELLQLKPTDKNGAGTGQALKSRDPLYEQAIEIVIREGRGSVSLLQRALGIGYGRAARLVDFMAEDGIVGHYNGAQAREVLFTLEQWDEMRESRATAESA
jgi:S-DNA-T family DNA segregation ATPase FtsK/SpoIIIE